jgi:hypothetical protein
MTVPVRRQALDSVGHIGHIGHIGRVGLAAWHASEGERPEQRPRAWPDIGIRITRPGVAVAVQPAAIADVQPTLHGCVGRDGPFGVGQLRGHRCNRKPAEGVVDTCRSSRASRWLAPTMEPEPP